MGSATGARESGKQATRKALIEAALEEFAERGFDAPSLDAICARAGYTRGAFYVHFRNRDELVVAAMEQTVRTLLDAVIADTGSEDDIQATVRRFVGIALIPQPDTGEVYGPAFHRLIEACRRSEALRQSFVALLEEAIGRVASAARAGQAQARLRDDIDPQQMAQLLVILALGARTAQEIGLWVDLKAARDAALTMLQKEGDADA